MNDYILFGAFVTGTIAVVILIVTLLLASSSKQKKYYEEHPELIKKIDGSLKEKSKIGLFGKIKSSSDALKLIKDCSIAYAFIGSLTLLVGLLLMPDIIFDGILYLALTGILYKFKSRAAAVLLFLLSLAEGVVTVTNRIGMSHAGGSNIFLAIIMIFAGFRAVQATFKLKKFTTL